MQQEEVYRVLGRWGPFQRRLLLLVSLPVMLYGFQLMMAIVIFAAPAHRCRVPGLVNDTYQVQSDSHRRLVDSFSSAPRLDSHQPYHQCRLLLPTNHTAATTTTNLHYPTTNPLHASTSTPLRSTADLQQETRPCYHWVFDDSEFDSTVITEFELVCERKALRAHFNMVYMAGSMVGAPLTGIVCDWLGRKPAFFGVVLINLLAGIFSAFPPSPYLLLALRFIQGVSGIGIYLALYVLGVEFAGPSRRNRMVSQMMMTWLCGPFLAAALSYVLRSWRQLQLVSSAPLAVCLLFWRILPESPRWLLSKKRHAEARLILLKVARVNNIQLGPSFLQQPPADSGHHMLCHARNQAQADPDPASGARHSSHHGRQSTHRELKSDTQIVHEPHGENERQTSDSQSEIKLKKATGLKTDGETGQKPDLATRQKPNSESGDESEREQKTDSERE